MIKKLADSKLKPEFLPPLFLGYLLFVLDHGPLHSQSLMLLHFSLFLPLLPELLLFGFLHEHLLEDSLLDNL